MQLNLSDFRAAARPLVTLTQISRIVAKRVQVSSTCILGIPFFFFRSSLGLRNANMNIESPPVACPSPVLHGPTPSREMSCKAL